MFLVAFGMWIASCWGGKEIPSTLLGSSAGIIIKFT